MKQKRFESELDIRAEIAKMRLKAKNCLAQAEAIELIIKGYIAKANVNGIPANEREYYRDQAHFERSKVVKLRRTAQLIDENRLPALTHTLAAFKTQPFPFLDSPAVVMEAK